MPSILVTFHDEPFAPEAETYQVPSSTYGAPAMGPQYYTVDRSMRRVSKQALAALETQKGYSAADTPLSGTYSELYVASDPSYTFSDIGIVVNRRKGIARRAPSATSSDSSAGYITFTPLNSTIIDRCLLYASGSSSATSKTPNDKSVASNSKTQGHAQSSVPIHSYSRHTDLANDRSPNPSPREIIRAQRAELDQARIKKDSAAAARAAIAAKRKKGKGGGRNGTAGKGKENGTAAAGAGGARSPSPAKEGPSIPTITTTAGSAPSTSAKDVKDIPARPTSRSLKRTWSSGLAPVSTALANTHGTANLAIGSPLKAVMGTADEEESAADAAHRAKRSRTDEPVAAGWSSATDTKGATTRRSSRSPPNRPPADSPPQPKTNPGLPGWVPPYMVTTRKWAKTSNGSFDGNGAAIPGDSAALAPGSGATGMRRAVSSAGSAAVARRSSAGSQGSEGAASGSLRSRRETTLPKALRDYEMRAGTAT